MPAQREALAQLSPALDIATYLAGGVAIAVELHHRMSIDLDLFVTHDFDADRLLPYVPTLRVVGRAAGTLHAEVVGVPGKRTTEPNAPAPPVSYAVDNGGFVGRLGAVRAV